MPGTKWWMWRPPTLTLRKGHHSSRMPRVEMRTSAKEPRKPASRLKRTVSRARRLVVAAHGDADGVERGSRRGFDQALAVGLLVGAALQHAAELAGEDDARAAQGDSGEPDGALAPSAPSRKRVRRPGAPRTRGGCGRRV